MPRISKRKQLYTAGKSYNTTNKRRCTKGSTAMADTIVNNARRIGLNVDADEITPGDGNCFYHAVVQQLHRSEIRSNILNLDPLPSHLTLRRTICQFIQQNQNDVTYINDYQTHYNNVLYQDYNMSWDSFISEQSNSGVYATELFIKTTAVLLGMNIHITSEHCTPEHPYNIITSSWNDDDQERTSSSNAILIGNISGIHFQSLLPNPNLEVETVDHEIEATATSNVPKTSMHHMCLRARAEVMHYIDAPMKSLSISTSAPASRVKETITFKLPYFAARDMNPIITPHSIGPMNNICPHCNALRFIDEPLNCCHNGKITLPELSYPEDLKQLLLGKSVQSKNFRDNISAFAFASFGANIYKLTNRGPYCFHIHGQIYH